MSFIYTHSLPTSQDSLNSTSPLTRSGSPRKGGPKEVRVNRVKLMETGRYCEAAIARKEPIEDIDAMFSLRINNVFDATEEDIRKEFEIYGQLGDVYRPVNKDRMTLQPFFFVRFMRYDDMAAAMNDLNGKILAGRPMSIVEARPKFELETSIY